ncbi:hypothetical protein F5882DRAFT_433341 [Hyaloscypha sp. PMI_1271]|nr:hypothetical protein F5882DRAFT_433341 [Hyaloscypha sp. PMI_1271]
MTDPLSITASAVGIIMPALHGTRLLLEDLHQLKDAPKTVKRLAEDVRSVDTALKLLQADRASVGFLKQGQIKAMSEQLSNYKLTINSVVSIATLYSSVRHSHITEEIKKAISTKQTEVKVVLENKLEELNLSSDDDNAAKLLNELLSKSREEAIAKAAGQESGLTTVTFGAQNSGFQARNINGGVSGTTFGRK